jgi:hypothetical protein
MALDMHAQRNHAGSNAAETLSLSLTHTHTLSLSLIRSLAHTRSSRAHPRPIAFTPGMDGDGDVASCTLSDGCAYVMPSVNRNRVLYDPVGGVDRVYRGVGLAGMAVHAPRKWPEAIPEVCNAPPEAQNPELRQVVSKTCWRIPISQEAIFHARVVGHRSWKKLTTAPEP